MGRTLLEQKQLYAAIDAFKELATLNSEFTDAYVNLGECYRLLGLGSDALEYCAKALSLQADCVMAHTTLGNVLKQENDLEGAIASFKRAIQSNPHFTGAYVNLSECYRLTGNLEDALTQSIKAISLDCKLAEAHNNHGKILQELGRPDEAIKAYIKATETKANYAKAFTNMGRCYWLKKDFVKAFEFMEWRWHANQGPIGTQYESSKPVWAGEDFNDVFVWREQGIGDEVMYSSMFPELSSKSGNLIIECDSRLISLYERSFSKKIKFVTDRNKVCETDYDAHISAGSLLKHLRGSIDDFRQISSGWLKADFGKTQGIRKKLKADSVDKIIGVSWLTKASYVKSKERNISLNVLAEYLLKIPGKYVSLQYGDTTEELSQVSRQTGVDIINFEEIDNFKDIDSLASLISACDLIVSIDNSTVHLAGALGIDTRVLLPEVADERWGLASTESYWYDSVTLYRQKTQGDWSDPLTRLVRDLTN
jgi:tetratricopeptide (TPR) repeat protein